MPPKLARSNGAVKALMKSGGADFPELDKRFGLSADFPRVVELDMGTIRANPRQPRRHFDEADLRALAASIERQGLLQPIIVIRLGEGEGASYEIAAGERRWRAHKLLHKPTIFALVTKGAADEIALVENLQRRDLDPLETASALAGLREHHRYSQEELATAVGLSASEISRMLRLVKLPSIVAEEYPAHREHVSKSMLFMMADAAGRRQLPRSLAEDQGGCHRARTAPGEARSVTAKAGPLEAAGPADSCGFLACRRKSRAPREDEPVLHRRAARRLATAAWPAWQRALELTLVRQPHDMGEGRDMASRPSS